MRMKKVTSSECYYKVPGSRIGQKIIILVQLFHEIIIIEKFGKITCINQSY